MRPADIQRPVLGDGVEIVDRFGRRVFAPFDQQRDGGQAAARDAVVDLVNKSIGPGESRLGCVQERPVPVELQRPVLGAAEFEGGQRVAVGVVVVRQNAIGDNLQWLVRHRVVQVIDRYR